MGIIHDSANSKDIAVTADVQDTGLGINAKNLQELFRADVKKMSRGTANEEGTGLGLMLCKEFIDYHKGNIEVESVLGKGSAFIVSLPNENKN